MFRLVDIGSYFREIYPAQQIHPRGVILILAVRLQMRFVDYTIRNSVKYAQTIGYPVILLNN